MSLITHLVLGSLRAARRGQNFPSGSSRRARSCGRRDSVRGLRGEPLGWAWGKASGLPGRVGARWAGQSSPGRRGAATRTGGGGRGRQGPSTATPGARCPQDVQGSGRAWSRACSSAPGEASAGLREGQGGRQRVSHAPQSERCSWGRGLGGGPGSSSPDMLLGARRPRR